GGNGHDARHGHRRGRARDARASPGGTRRRLHARPRLLLQPGRARLSRRYVAVAGTPRLRGGTPRGGLRLTTGTGSPLLRRLEGPFKPADPPRKAAIAIANCYRKYLSKRRLSRLQTISPRPTSRISTGRHPPSGLRGSAGSAVWPGPALSEGHG